jgi:F-type H+-transporting ATPase subunit delta
MKDFRVAERYARALSLSLPDESTLDEAGRAMTLLRRTFTSNHDLHSALANPAIDADVRVRLLNGVIQNLEISPAVGRLLEVLLRRGRIDWLPAVARVFNTLVDERLNRVGASVRTATPLNEAQEARLQAALEQFSGKAVRMEIEIEPELLGGVVTEIGGKLIDGSVRTRLNRLKNTLITEETLGA